MPTSKGPTSLFSHLLSTLQAHPCDNIFGHPHGLCLHDLMTLIRPHLSTMWPRGELSQYMNPRGTAKPWQLPSAGEPSLPGKKHHEPWDGADSSELVRRLEPSKPVFFRQEEQRQSCGFCSSPLLLHSARNGVRGGLGARWRKITDSTLRFMYDVLKWIMSSKLSRVWIS